MKRDFQINLTALANDDETKRMTEALMTSAAGNAANHDADRYVAVGGQPDDGKVENDRFVAEGPGDGKVETGRYIAVSVGDDKIEDALRDGTSGSARVGSDSYVAIGAGDDKIDEVLREGISGSVRVGGDKYVAIEDDGKIFD